MVVNNNYNSMISPSCGFLLVSRACAHTHTHKGGCLGGSNHDGTVVTLVRRDSGNSYISYTAGNCEGEQTAISSCFLSIMPHHSDSALEMLPKCIRTRGWCGTIRSIPVAVTLSSVAWPTEEAASWIVVNKTSCEEENSTAFTPNEIHLISREEFFITGNGLLYRLL